MSPPLKIYLQSCDLTSHIHGVKNKFSVKELGNKMEKELRNEIEKKDWRDLIKTKCYQLKICGQCCTVRDRVGMCEMPDAHTYICINICIYIIYMYIQYTYIYVLYIYINILYL